MKCRRILTDRSALWLIKSAASNLYVNTAPAHVRPAHSDRIPVDQIPHMIEKYSKYSPSPLSVQNFLDFGRSTPSEEASFNFLIKEVPVRLANILQELSFLPPRLLEQPSVRMVKSWYVESFHEIVQYAHSDRKDPAVIKKFTEAVIRVRNRHNRVIQQMAEGILELKSQCEVDSATESSIQYFLDRFYIMRISIRMLLLQHITIAENTALALKKKEEKPQYEGLIDPACEVTTVVQEAYEDAKFLCEQYYMAAPDLQLREVRDRGHLVTQSGGSNGSQPGNNGRSITMAYIPAHLHHIAFELFKNAMRATIEYHGPDVAYPPISTTVAKGPRELSIKISDQGGGFAHRDVGTLFKYLYTTASLPIYASNNPDAIPLAGYGYGLPLSRLYARYFNGNLELFPQEGLGTDAIIYLNALSEDSFEHLPVFNAASRRQYRAQSLSSDWVTPPSSPVSGEPGQLHPSLTR